jgi:hypothetical protein
MQVHGVSHGGPAAAACGPGRRRYGNGQPKFHLKMRIRWALPIHLSPSSFMSAHTAQTMKFRKFTSSAAPLTSNSFEGKNMNEPCDSEENIDETLVNGGREWECTMLGLRLRGLQWGDCSAKNKVLCVHGYMDNAMSFATLAPLLIEDVHPLHVIAIDLPGQAAVIDQDNPLYSCNQAFPFQVMGNQTTLPRMSEPTAQRY